MNSEEVRNIATARTPKVKTIIHKDYFRHDVLNFLPGNRKIGIELGVAAGHFSKRMIMSGKFIKFYGVDLYEDHHNTQEYISALTQIGIKENYTLLRMSFDDAINLFDDEFFDFIYFDGYAHTGEEGGSNFSSWYKKLKVGGIFSGDDYHDDWPLVKWAVNDMVRKLGSELHVTGKTETTHLNRYPSWFFVKSRNQIFEPNEELKNIGFQIRRATRKQQQEARQISVSQLSNLLLQIKDKRPDIARILKEKL